ncbi:MAG: hypothetical protein ACR2NN_03470 [Bryobacteraceae bacterium]
MLAHAAISALIISLIYQTLTKDPRQRSIALLITAGVICFALFSAYTYQVPNLNRWMTPISRNLSFGEELLNLILWSVLLQRRASDYLLLMVSAGIGVQVTGEVIGITLALYAHNPSVKWVPNSLVFLCEVSCLLIWLRAFRGAHSGADASTTPLPFRSTTSSHS